MRKARSVQEAGGSMVIISNYRDEDLSQLIMIDDGTGLYIAIPAVMINYTDGTKLEAAINESILEPNNPSKNVVLIIDFVMVKIFLSLVLNTRKIQMIELNTKSSILQETVTH